MVRTIVVGVVLSQLFPPGAIARGGTMQLEHLATALACAEDPGAEARRIRAVLKRLSRQAAEATAGASSLQERRERFDRFFFRTAGFGGEADASTREGLLLHRVLERRRGTCVGLAQAYLALAERLGLPVVAVATPNHIFVRWLEEGRHVNVELLEAGKQIADEEYRQRNRIREADPSNPIFMRNLNTTELLARVYNNLGVIRSRSGDIDGGISNYGEAIRLDPRFPAPHYNRGLDHLNAGRVQNALSDLDAALTLHPADAWALNNRGLARLRIGKWEAAIEDLEKALAVDPTLPAGRKNLEIARLLLRDSKLPANSPRQEGRQEGAGGELAEPRP